MNRILEVQATVCLRNQVHMTVAGRCEKRTESEIIAAQYQALRTKYLETQILQKKTREKFEQGQTFDDRVQHTKAHALMKIELFIRRKIEHELNTNKPIRENWSNITQQKTL